MDDDQPFDAITIGAGIGGIIASARYLALHPDASLLILDRNNYVGGVYSRDRIYPGFHTQFVLGLAEFSDLKMREPPVEERLGDCFKAGWLGKYLEEFCEGKEFGDGGKGGKGGSLMGRVRFGCEVLDVIDQRGKEGEESNWMVIYRDLEQKQGQQYSVIGSDGSPQDINIKPRKLRTKHLIIAAGEYSLPNIPSFPSQSTFSAPIIHSTNFGASHLLSTPDIKHIAILGAGKSAADILYQCLKSLPPTTQIHWIIRQGGAYAPIDIPSPYANVVEAAQTRTMSLLQPCIWHDEGNWWVWFLHRTWLGILLVSWIFSQVDKEAKKRAGYGKRGEEATQRGFDDLEYDPGLFWQNNPAGALHHDDFWDLVSGRVRVHKGTIEDVSGRVLYLSNGKQVACDALILATGFKLGLTFMPDDLKARLGLPHNLNTFDPIEEKKWTQLEKEQEKNVLEKYAILASPPPHNLKQPSTTPYRLYRGIAPLNDSSRSIVFINHLVAGNMMMNAEAQAHWAVAYLTRRLSLPSTSDMEKEVALQVAYCRKRMLSSGQLGNYLAFDMITYIDGLMGDLGVRKVWRRKGWWGVNRPEDLGAAWERWIEGGIGREEEL